jgi:hypothetical protein
LIDLLLDYSHRVVWQQQIDSRDEKLLPSLLSRGPSGSGEPGPHVGPGDGADHKTCPELGPHRNRQERADRGLTRRGALLFQLAVALAVAAVIAAIWALAHGGPFVHAFGVACLIFGGVALLFGAFGIGGMSPSIGLVETSGRGTNPLPGMPALFRTSPGTTVVNSTGIFFITGIAMVVIGFVILG